MSSNVEKLDKQQTIYKTETYNPEYVFNEELSDIVKTETTHILAGYYDLLNKKWNQINCKKVNSLTEKDIFDVMFDTKLKSSNDFFNNEQLYRHNIKMFSEDPYLSFVRDDELREKANLEDIFNLIIDTEWYGLNDKEVCYVQLEKNISTLLKILSNYLKENNINSASITSLINHLRAFNCF